MIQKVSRNKNDEIVTQSTLYQHQNSKQANTSIFKSRNSNFKESSTYSLFEPDYSNIQPFQERDA